MRIYEPLNSVDKLSWRKHESEFQIQAELYTALRQDGFTVLGEYGIRGRVFLDLVIFKSKKPVAIVEVKTPFVGETEDLDATTQGLQYRSFGVPVILFWSMENYPKLKKFLQENYREPSKEPIKQTYDRIALDQLRRGLNVAAMRAYDAKLPELEAELEKKETEIAKLIAEQK